MARTEPHPPGMMDSGRRCGGDVTGDRYSAKPRGVAAGPWRRTSRFVGPVVVTSSASSGSCAVTSASSTRNRFWMSLTQGRRGAAAPGRSKMSPAGNGFDGRLVRPWNIGSEWTSALFHGPWCGGPLAGIRCPNRPTGNRAAADRWLVVVNDHRQTVTAVMGRDARCRNPGDDLPATSLTPQPRRRAPAGDHRRHSDSETPFPNDMPKTDAARLPGRRDCGSRIPLRHQAVTPVRRRANFLASKHNTPAPAIKAVEGSGIAVRVTVAFPSYPCV